MKSVYFILSLVFANTICHETDCYSAANRSALSCLPKRVSIIPGIPDDIIRLACKWDVYQDEIQQLLSHKNSINPQNIVQTYKSNHLLSPNHIKPYIQYHDHQPFHTAVFGIHQSVMLDVVTTMQEEWRMKSRMYYAGEGDRGWMCKVAGRCGEGNGYVEQALEGFARGDVQEEDAGGIIRSHADWEYMYYVPNGFDFIICTHLKFCPLLHTLFPKLPLFIYASSSLIFPNEASIDQSIFERLRYIIDLPTTFIAFTSAIASAQFAYQIGSTHLVVRTLAVYTRGREGGKYGKRSLYVGRSRLFTAASDVGNAFVDSLEKLFAEQDDVQFYFADQHGHVPFSSISRFSAV